MSRFTLLPRTRGRRIALGTVLILALVYTGWRSYLRREIHAELDRIVAEGYPVSTAELDAWHTYPEGENAADLFVKAFAQCPQPPLDQWDGLPVAGSAQIPPPGEAIPPEMLAAITAHLDMRAAVPELLAQAAKIPECRYPFKWSDGANTLMPGLAGARRCVQLLHLHALIAIENDDPEAAAQLLETMWKVEGSLRNEPNVISQYLRRGAIHSSCFATVNIARRGNLTDEQLERLMAAVKQSGGHLGMLRAFVGERAFGIQAFEDTREAAIWLDLFMDDPKENPILSSPRLTPIKVMALRLSGLWDLDELAFLRTSRRAIEIAEEAAEDSSQAPQEKLNIPPSYCGITEMFLPQYIKLLSNQKITQQQLDTTLVTLANIRYRLRHGHEPTSNEDLVPDFLDKLPVEPDSGDDSDTN